MSKNIYIYFLTVSLSAHLVNRWWVQLLALILWQPFFFRGESIFIFYIGFLVGTAMSMSQTNQKLVTNIEVLGDDDLLITYFVKFRIKSAQERLKNLRKDFNGEYLYGSAGIKAILLSSYESNVEYYIADTPSEYIKIKHILDRIEFRE